MRGLKRFALFLRAPDGLKDFIHSYDSLHGAFEAGTRLQRTGGDLRWEAFDNLEGKPVAQALSPETGAKPSKP